MFPIFRLTLFVLVLAVSGHEPAEAVHLDIELKGDGDRLAAGFCLTRGVGCDLPGALGKLGLPAGSLPTDAETGQKIFAADFADPFKPYETKNPGFNAVANALTAGEFVRYRALGRLRFWDPNGKTWTDAAAGVQVRLFGGLDAKTGVRTDFSQCGGLLVCPKETQETVYEDGSTVFSGSGIGGAENLVIDNASTSGSFHTHLDWFLEDPAGKAGGPRGAYLVSLQLLSAQRPQPSEPFLIAFNNGLSADGFAEAIAALMAAPIPPPSLTDDPPPGSEAPSERSFDLLKYRETGREKLAGCPSGCREAVQGSVAIDVRLGTDSAFGPASLGTAGELELSVGTHRLVVRLEEGSRSKLSVARSGRLGLPLWNAENRRVGQLRIRWTGSRLNLRYELPRTTVLADGLLGGASLRRPTLNETVVLRSVDGTGQDTASWKTTLDIAGSLKTRQVRRGNARYELGQISLNGQAGR